VLSGQKNLILRFVVGSFLFVANQKSKAEYGRFATETQRCKETKRQRGKEAEK
jgi:hypothetical protein